jgi:cerevisin
LFTIRPFFESQADRLWSLIPFTMRIVITLSLAAVAAAVPAFNHDSIHRGAAPLLSSSNADVVPNSYIIKFKKHVTESSASDHHSWVHQIHASREDERLELRRRSPIPLVDDVFRGLQHTYKIGEHFMGYSGHFDDDVIEQVRRHPDVRPSHHFRIDSTPAGSSRLD